MRIAECGLAEVDVVVDAVDCVDEVDVVDGAESEEAELELDVSGCS